MGTEEEAVMGMEEVTEEVISPEDGEEYVSMLIGSSLKCS